MVVERTLNFSLVADRIQARRRCVRPCLRRLALVLILLLTPIRHLGAQANLIGTSANSGDLVGYAITQNSATVTVESVGQIGPTGKIGHLFGSFIGGKEKDLVKVRKIRGDTFAFMTASSSGSNIVRRVKLSNKVGALYYLLTGFDINSDGFDDVAIVDVSEHRYRWSIVENPIRASARELQSFYLGFTGDRVEWSLSPSRDVEFAAVRQSFNTGRTRALLRNSVTGNTRTFRSRWQQPSGLLIPLRLGDSFRYDPGIALYSPAKRSILMFDSQGGFVSYELPMQRCGGYQAVTNVDSQGTVAAIEVCGNGSYTVAQRTESASGDQGDSIIASGALPEPISNLRRGDLTAMRDPIGEVAVPIVVPGSDGSAVLGPVSQAPASGVSPPSASPPQATPTAPPEDTEAEATPTYTPTYTPTPNALFQLGGPGNEGLVASSFLEDGSGALIASFTSDLTLDCAGVISYESDRPLVLVSLNANLQCMWARKLPAAFNWAQPKVAALENGDLIIAGTTNRSSDFGDGISRNPSAKFITYIARYDGNTGDLTWFRDFAHGSTTSFARLKDLALEPSGKAFVITGDYQTSIDFGGGLHIPVDSLEPIIARFSVSDGSYLWSAMYVGGGPQDFMRVRLVGSELIIAGAGRGSLALGGACGTVSWSGGGRGSLLVKMALSGAGYQCVWYKKTDATCGEDWAYEISSGAEGEIYSSGEFCGTKIFGGVTMTASASSRSTFISAHSSFGANLWGAGGVSWKTFSGVSLLGKTVGGYLLGTHVTWTNPNYGNGFAPSVEGSRDTIFLKINPADGQVVAIHAPSAPGAQYAWIQRITNQGGLIIAGSSDADWVVSPQVYISGVQGSDVFIARISDPF
jgi:hypothetical protein